MTYKILFSISPIHIQQDTAAVTDCKCRGLVAYDIFKTFYLFA